MTKDDVYIHPSAIVECDDIGSGTRIWAFCNVQKGARIGADVNICDHCFVEQNVIVGDRVTVKNGVSLWDGMTIEDDVFIGPNAAFTNDIYPRSKARKDEFDKTVIKQGATIGANATIIAGRSVGRYSFVGAGAVITKDVPDYTLWLGNPARMVGYVCRCAKRLSVPKSVLDGNESRFELLCECGTGYEVAGGKMRASVDREDS